VRILMPLSLGIALTASADFTDVTDSAGIDFRHENGATAQRLLPETMGSGAAFFDYDNDGRLDLMVVNSAGPHRLYRNGGDGAFSDVSEPALPAAGGFGMGVCVGDVNGDGHRDVYLTRFGAPNALLVNTGAGSFTEGAAAAGVGDAAWGTSCAFADFDGDGDLDLYVVNYLDSAEVQRNLCGRRGGETRYCHPDNFSAAPDRLYLNTGPGLFRDATESSGVGAASGKGLGVLVADYDLDGDADIFVANDSTPNFLWRNVGDARFEEVGAASGFAYNGHGESEAGMGITAGDYDNDGRLDIFVTNFDFETNTLYRGEAGGVFWDVTARTGLAADREAYMGWGTAFLDVDNDAWLDLYIVNGHLEDNVREFTDATRYGQRNQLFHNGGDGRFRDIHALGTAEVGRGAAFGDYDDDGDIDVFIVNNGQRGRLLRNDARGQHHWLTLALVGRRGNADAYGAQITLQTGSLRRFAEIYGGGSYLSANDPRVSFGLGRHTRVDHLVIRWPDGETQRLADLAVDRILTVWHPSLEKTRSSVRLPD
jgi:predicted nucleotidyltransferase